MDGQFCCISCVFAGPFLYLLMVGNTKFNTSLKFSMLTILWISLQSKRGSSTSNSRQTWPSIGYVLKFIWKRKILKITAIVNKLYTVAVVENAYATKSSSIFRSRRQNEHILTQLCAHQSSFKIIIRSCIQFELSKNQSINYRKYS